MTDTATSRPAVTDEQTDTGLATGQQPTVEREDRSRVVTALVGAALVAAVLVPLVLFTVRALNAPVNFDGGMNLQVAQSLANGDGYVRFYDEPLHFPHEVQTNGPFLYVAAAAITLFGENQFAYQFASLAFIGGLLVAVSVLLRREPLVVRVLGPAVVLMASPSIPIFGLGALGEVATTFFFFAMILAFVQAVRSPERAPLWVVVAGLAFGAAYTTKTFAIGGVGALAVGVLCVLAAARTKRQRLLVLAATAAVAAVPVGNELYRLVSLGSVGEYRAWWSNQRDSITTQSGLEDTGGGLVQTFLDHMHVLSRLVDYPAELLLVVLFLPLAWIGGLFVWRWRRDGLRETLSEPHMVAMLTTGVIAASYLLWWLLLLPEAKLWIRRIMPGLLALHLLYLFFVPWAVRVGRDLIRRYRDGELSVSARVLPLAALGVTLALVAVVPANYARDQIDGATRGLLEGQESWLDANEAAASYIESHDDLRYYGDEWWSAPVISLMSDTGFYNLGQTDICTLDPDRDRLVWDYDAKTIRSQEPWTRDGRLVYEQVAAFGWFVTIYSVGPAPGQCD